MVSVADRASVVEAAGPGVTTSSLGVSSMRASEVSLHAMAKVPAFVEAICRPVTDGPAAGVMARPKEPPATRPSLPLRSWQVAVVLPPATKVVAASVVSMRVALLGSNLASSSPQPREGPTHKVRAGMNRER